MRRHYPALAHIYFSYYLCYNMIMNLPDNVVQLSIESPAPEQHPTEVLPPSMGTLIDAREQFAARTRQANALATAALNRPAADLPAYPQAVHEAVKRGSVAAQKLTVDPAEGQTANQAHRTLTEENYTRITDLKTQGKFAYSKPTAISEQPATKTPSPPLRKALGLFARKTS
jgi:hypothetical protein